MRLIVRRVRPTPGSQLALFTTWSYHAFVTNRSGPALELEADHRRHAIVEQTIAELKSAGLAHLPSGNFMTNAAWLALTVMAHNLGRAVGQLAGAAPARDRTLQEPADRQDPHAQTSQQRIIRSLRESGTVDPGLARSATRSPSSH